MQDDRLAEQLDPALERDKRIVRPQHGRKAIGQINGDPAVVPNEFGQIDTPLVKDASTGADENGKNNRINRGSFFRRTAAEIQPKNCQPF